MSDILPKLKLYIFLSIFLIIINIAYVLSSFAYGEDFNILLLIAGFGTAFIPFVSTITVVLSSANIPVEFVVFIATITAIISFIQVFLIAMFILQTVANLIWNPDV